jgi:hypothetical protein
MITVSPDGYVRLTFAELIQLQMHNIYTETDVGIAEDLQSQGVPAQQAGISEWQSATAPAISLGLTFFVDGHERENRRVHLAPEPIRGNVMLIDARGYDLGEGNEPLLRLWGELYGWRASIDLRPVRTH